MLRLLPKSKVAAVFIIVCFSFMKSFAANEPIPTGSFIVNMGVTPQTYDNGVKPWGMLHDLIKNYRVQVKWIINPVKAKDGIDFSHNNIDYRGGTFIIPTKFRTAAVNARIAFWQTQGVQGANSVSDFNIDVTYTLKYTPRWTFDFQNGNIALAFLDAAGIPTLSYPKKLPEELNTCDDLFVMPHADPTWDTHKNMYYWNQSNRGWIWGGCHATSVIENMVNPLDSSLKMNFLSQNGLLLWGDHADGTPPYSYRFPNDPEMQFMGIADGAMQNGSEQVFLPKTGGWRPSTKVAVYDATQINVPATSPGEAAAIVYGRAFGDVTRGEVMYTGGHNIERGSTNPDAVAAIRAFYNFSFLSVYDKALNPSIVGPINLLSLSSYTYRVSIPINPASANYYYKWSSSCGGKFSNSFDTVTVFTAPSVMSCGPCTLTCTVTDGCGREYYQSFDVSICPAAPPVALDKAMTLISNPDGSLGKTIGDAVPLAGTDEDGMVVSYVLKSLPSNGVLSYDNDNNIATANTIINALPSGELILSPAQMKTLSFDPNNGFGSTTSFQYTVIDNSNLRDLTPATYTIPVNPPPVAITEICTPIASNADVQNMCALEATDNGTIKGYRITSLPPATQCTIYSTQSKVYVGQFLTPLQASSLQYKPSGTYVGYSEILFTAIDNNEAIDNTPATITLQMVNQPPVAADVSSAAITNPVGSTKFNVMPLKAEDKDGAVGYYKIISLPTTTEGVLFYNNGTGYVPVSQNQILTIAQASSLMFDPVDALNGVADFTYTAGDNNGLEDNTPAIMYLPTQQVPPVAHDTINNPIYTGATWKQLFAITATDPDATNTIVSYKILTIPDATEGKLRYLVGTAYTNIVVGTVIPASAANAMQFDPVVGFTGIAEFTFTATDNEQLVDKSPAVVKIPVTNQPPSVPNFIAPAMLNNLPITTIQSISGSDPDGKPLKYGIILSVPDSTKYGKLYLGNVLVEPGDIIMPNQASTLSFHPAANSSDTAVFTYNVADEGLMTDPTPGLYKIPIVSSNYAPVSTDITMANINASAVSNNCLPLVGTDADGTVEGFVLTNLPIAAQGILYVNNIPAVVNQTVSKLSASKITFVPSGNFAGDINFKYRSFDNDGTFSNMAKQFIKIVNTLPLAISKTIVEVKKGATIKIPAPTGTDADGAVINYKILSLPTLGTLQVDALGTNIYTNILANQILSADQAKRIRIITGNIIGTTSFNFRAIDNINDSSNVAIYTIPVSGSSVNQIPVANAIVTNNIVFNNTASPINALSALDYDGSINSFRILSIPPSYYGMLWYNTTGTTYDSITIGDKLITIAQAATLKFKPSGLFYGPVKFTYYAYDNDGSLSNLSTFIINVANTDPVSNDITTGAISSNGGPAFIQTLSGTDESVVESFTITTLPSANSGVLVMDGSPIKLGQIIPMMYANRLEFDPNAGFIGNATFNYVANDNFGATDKTAALFTIPVVNFAPEAVENNSQVITNAIGTPAKTITGLQAADNDGTIASYTILTLPTNGVLLVNNVVVSTLPATGLVITLAQANQLSFNPNDNFSGTTSFDYTATDNLGAKDLTAASYKIFANVPPVSQSIINAAFTENAVINLPIAPLVATDDVSVSFYSILSLPSITEGVLYINNVAVTSLTQVQNLSIGQASQLRFASTNTFKGAIFTYTATDNLGIIDVTPSVYFIPSAKAGVLPIKLLSFSGLKVNEDNELKWATSEEVNMKHFEIEHSTDGNNFATINIAAAKGNASSTSNYAYTHKSVTVGKHYYRLKSVDNEGKATYSNIVTLSRSGNSSSEISGVSPNPFTIKLAVNYESDNNSEIKICILNAQGKTVRVEKIKVIKGSNTLYIGNLNGLPSGSYVLVITDSTKKVTTQIIKV